MGKLLPRQNYCKAEKWCRIFDYRGCLLHKTCTIVCLPFLGPSNVAILWLPAFQDCIQQVVILDKPQYCDTQSQMEQKLPMRTVAWFLRPRTVGAGANDIRCVQISTVLHKFLHMGNRGIVCGRILGAWIHEVCCSPH